MCCDRAIAKALNTRGTGFAHSHKLELLRWHLLLASLTTMTSHACVRIALAALLLTNSHALRPGTSRTAHRTAPRMVLDAAAASQVIAAMPSLDTATTLLASTAPVVLDYGALATKAIGGGTAGALAGVAQVGSLMWLRTAMNYQYVNGGNGTLATVKALYEEGGLPRLYRGVQYALVQNPLSRFGDAAANAVIPTLVIALVPGIPLPASQAVASATAASWRILIAPVDALKTALQVDGDTTALTDRIQTLGPGVLWRGSLAAAAATFVGNYPWFLTYNSLDASLPAEIYDGPASALVRRALLGVCASCVSDVCSNAIRVVKTKVQTSPDADTNPLQAAREILAEDGVEGLFLRGLETRLAINCLQGAIFSVAWKYFEKALT